MAKWALTWIIMMLQNVGEGLKCFQCDNTMNPACGINFKAYQYPPELCPGHGYKCGLQRQRPKGDFIGIIRACYPLGSLGLEDESDGCYELWNSEYNTSFLFCLCSEDYCNFASSSPTCSLTLIAVVLVISVVALILQR